MQATEINPKGKRNSIDHAAKTIVVMGGGLAGLAASMALATVRQKVYLLESKQRLGGRAGSFLDTVSGQLIDYCQHVSMGCCTNFHYFCQTIGVKHWLEPQPVLYFFTRDGKHSLFKADPLPAPFHLTRSFWKSHYLTLPEKCRIVLGLTALMMESPQSDPPFLDWLKKHRQNQRTIQRYWRIVLTSALNEEIENIGLRYARKVFLDGFLRHRDSFLVHIPTVPLQRFYETELDHWFKQHDVTTAKNQAVKEIVIQGNRIQFLLLRDGSKIEADWYISALPFHRLLDLLPADIVQKHSYFAKLNHLGTSPITSVHLWLDRAITDLPHAVIVDGISQWIFARGQQIDGSFYYQIVISASQNLFRQGHEVIIAQLAEELRQTFPLARMAKIIHARVVTEQRATFRVFPGVDSFRPEPISPIGNLILAGDYTQTAWPATMEGAVRSGYRAAEIITQKIGIPNTFVQKDL